MIAAIRGRVDRSDGSEVIVSLGPIALRVLVPVSAAARMVPGMEVDLHTYLAIRQDHIALYGFDSLAGLAMFEQLISVSGVGPKGALGLLSTLDAEELRAAIIEGNPRILSQAPGIGARVAARIIGELQEKVAALPPLPNTNGEPSSQAAALDALTGLGYPLLEARRALDAVPPGDGRPEDLIRAALQVLDQRAR